MICNWRAFYVVFGHSLKEKDSGKHESYSQSNAKIIKKLDYMHGVQTDEPDEITNYAVFGIIIANVVTHLN
jgi:hypothetical protein